MRVLLGEERLDGCLPQLVVMIGNDAVQVDEEGASCLRGFGCPGGITSGAATNLGWTRIAAGRPIVAGNQRANDGRRAFGLGLRDVLANVPAVCVDGFLLALGIGPLLGLIAVALDRTGGPAVVMAELHHDEVA